MIFLSVEKVIGFAWEALREICRWRSESFEELVRMRSKLNLLHIKRRYKHVSLWARMIGQQVWEKHKRYQTLNHRLFLERGFYHETKRARRLLPSLQAPRQLGFASLRAGECVLKLK